MSHKKNTTETQETKFKSSFLFSKQNQISTLIFDMGVGVDFKDKIWLGHKEEINFRINHLKEVINLMDFIVTLGEEEHSSDWDIGVKIIYKVNGIEREIITEQRFSHIEIDGEDLLIENELDMGDYNDDDISYHRVPIMDIIEIKYYN